MGYYRTLYVGPFIEVEPKKKTHTFFGCPICKCEVAKPKQTDQLVLFPDPVTHKGKKHQEVECCDVTIDVPRSQAYKEMNAFENEHPEFVDVFFLLQRESGNIWLSPNSSKGAPRTFSYEINSDPMLNLSDFDVEKEMQWMQEKYSKEIVVLATFFESWKMNWGIVVDGC
jgi:hypothetical protein